MPGILKTEKQGRGYVITIEKNAEEILQKLLSYQPADLHVYDRTLEEVFEEYAGRGACD